jgi:hypothetical protein
MTAGDGIFLGLVSIAFAIIVSTMVVCLTMDARERARSNTALAPPPGPAKSARRRA